MNGDSRTTRSPRLRSKKPIRWWPAALVVFATAVALVVLWWGEGQHDQGRVMNTFLVLAVGVALLLLWLLFLSRLPWKRRLAIFAGVVLAGAAVPALFRIEGVTGNLVPILAFRWSGDAAFETGSGAAEVETSPYDFPQFLGPNRDGRIDAVRLASDWSTEPPREIWRREVGAAWSGFAVVGDAAVTLEQRDGREVVARYDLETGEVVWTHGVDATFDTTIGGSGPRSTPTIHRGRVYTLGATGILRALDLVSGELLWQRELGTDHGSQPPSWGFAGSPLLYEATTDDESPAEGESETLVVVPAGGEGTALVAYRAADGEPAWAAGEDRVGYSSPSLHTFEDEKQIVVLNGGSVAGHDPATGRLLWTFPWPSDQPNVAQPVALGEDRLLVSSGYGVGASLLEIGRSEDGTWQADELWHSPRLKAKFTNVVVHDGYIYGLDDGVLVCLDPETGERCWKRGRYGHGQVLLVGDLLLVQTESGEIVLVEPNPDEHRELGRIEALSGKSWNNPTLAGSRLLVRNADEVIAFELPLDEPLTRR